MLLILFWDRGFFIIWRLKMGNFQLTVQTEDTTAKVNQDVILGANQGRTAIRQIIDLLKSSAGIQKQASLLVSTGEKASGTFTLVSVPEDDTVVIGAVTLTAKASPSGENQFSQAGTDTADAASLAAVINAHSVLSKVVTATSALGVVTVTAQAIGLAGNQIAISETGSSITASGSYLAGGTVTGAVTYSLGL
jgi:phage tail sheath gpL-like